MTSIIVCNTGTDSLSKIDLATYSVSNIQYNMCDKPIGPYSIKEIGDKIITANSYDNSVSIFKGKEMQEVLNIKNGAAPSDIILLDNILYTVCADSNAVIIHDIVDSKIMYSIKTGSWPHSIDYSKFNKKCYISNMEEDSIDIIDSKEYIAVKKLKTPQYPTKVKVSLDQRYLYVCESYLGSDNNGFLDIFYLEDDTRIARIEVGSSPMDVYEDISQIYTVNFTEGSISIIDKKTLKVINNIYVGGMPRSIIVKDSKIYVADYLKGKVIEIENNMKKNIITVGTEPNAMILV